MPKLLSNRYLLIEKLGSGAFGETFLAEDTQSPSRRKCVVKRLNPGERCDFQVARERFDREAAVLEVLGEENRQIPQLYAHIVEGNEFYLVQELIDGPTLTQKLAAEGPLAEAEVRRILVGLLPVLEFIHNQNIIHRDVKPDNIILRTKDNLPVLIDFGVVKEVTQLDSVGNPTSSVVAGTPVFMPLEQAAGHPMYCSDLYALGMTAIQLLTGKRLRDMQDHRKGILNWRPHATDVSVELMEVLSRATEMYPQNRYETAAEMLKALEQTRPESELTVLRSDRRRVEPVVIPPPPVIVSPNPKNSVLGGLKKFFKGFSRKPEPPPPPQKQAELQPQTQLPAVFKNSLGMEFVLIPAGEFQMGSTQFDDAKPVHKVRISQPFYLGKYQVTQVQWQAVMGSNPSYFKGDRLPVESVSWENVQEFIKRLNGKGEGTYRLPSEAEWEYACRAGSSRKYCFGDDETQLEEYAWYGYEKMGKTTHPVGQKKPNRWGLYDMHGNVWEWCEDWYDGGYYALSPANDPKGPGGGSRRVIRGGGWYGTAVNCWSAYRDYYLPGGHLDYLGFRLVRITDLDQPRVERSILESNQRRVEPVVIPPPPLPPPASTPIIVSPTPENPNLGRLERQVEGFSRKAKPQPQAQVPAVFKNSLGMEFVLISAGEFQMGSTQFDDAKPAHKVRISQPFYLEKYQVTQVQWQAVMGNNPSRFKRDNLPVERVSWEDCQEFIQKLNARGEGSYRLPTEAEWEYVCRAGTTGDYAGNLDEMGWYESNSEDKTHPVGQKKPNGWGLYDMHGNVWEWCEDWYDSGYYVKSPESDPKGPSKGSYRVVRGGGWCVATVNCRSAFRGYYLPDIRSSYLGFRLLRITDLGQPRVEKSIPKSDQRRVEHVIISPPPLPPPASTPIIVSPNPENPNLGGFKRQLEGFSRKPEPPPPQKQAEPQPQAQLSAVFTNSFGMEFVLIPAGEFQMGSTQSDDEKPVHKVRVSQLFYLGKYQVTQAQWQAVMGDNPSRFKGGNLPVEMVSWEDCQKFIQRLNAKGEGAYRLPTEAEWEYACRAGTTGDYAGDLNKMGWYASNSGNKTHPVGQKKPNGWGLYDMHGNVWEWCEDWYNSGYYAKSLGSDPKGPSGGSGRVNRGGSWNDDAVNCRSADRYHGTPGYRSIDLGFRLLRAAR